MRAGVSARVSWLRWRGRCKVALLMPVRAAIVVMVAIAGCGPQLTQARLQPPPVSTSPTGAVAVTAVEVASTMDLYQGRPQLSSNTEIATRVEIDNRSDAPVTLPLADWRLVVTGPGGHKAVGTPVVTLAETPRFGAMPAETVAPVTLAPRQKRTLALMFRGLGGVPSDGALALRLETGDATAPLVLAAPAAPGPRWSVRGLVPMAFGLGIQRVVSSELELMAVQVHLYAGWRQLLFGFGIGGGLIARQLEAADTDPEAVLLMSPRIGWHVERWHMALLAGADFGQMSEFDGQNDHLHLALSTATIAARLPAPHWGRSVSPLPVVISSHGLSRGWVSVGYLYMFGRRGLPSGHGLSFEFAFAQVVE
jgi:hypothetical protein